MAVHLTTFYHQIFLYNPLYENMTGMLSSSKAEIRGYIKACVRLGKDRKKFSKNFVMCIKGNKCMSLRQVNTWVSKIKNGQTDLKDKHVSKHLVWLQQMQ